MSIKYQTRLVETFGHGVSKSLLVKTIAGTVRPPPNPDISCTPVSLTIDEMSFENVTAATYRINDGEIISFSIPRELAEKRRTNWNTMTPEEWAQMDAFQSNMAKVFLGIHDGGHHGCLLGLKETNGGTPPISNSTLYLGGLGTDGMIHTPEGELIPTAGFYTDISSPTEDGDYPSMKLSDPVPSYYKIEILPTEGYGEGDLYDGLLDPLLPVPPIMPALLRVSDTPEPLIAISCAKYIPNYGPFGLCEFELSEARFAHDMLDAVPLNWTWFVNGVESEVNVTDRGDYYFDFEYTTPQGQLITGESYGGHVQLQVGKAYDDAAGNSVTIKIVMESGYVASTASENESINVRLNDTNTVDICLTPKRIRCSDVNTGYMSMVTDYDRWGDESQTLVADVTINGTTYLDQVLYEMNVDGGIEIITIGNTQWSCEMTRMGYFDMELVSAPATNDNLKVSIQSKSGQFRIQFTDVDDGGDFLDDIPLPTANPSIRFDEATNTVTACVKLKPCAGATDGVYLRVEIDGIEQTVDPDDPRAEGATAPCYYDVIVDGVSLNPDHENLWDTPMVEIYYDEYRKYLVYHQEYAYPPEPVGTVHKVKLVPPPDVRGMKLLRQCTPEEVDFSNYSINPTYKMDEDGVISFCTRNDEVPT